MNEKSNCNFISINWPVWAETGMSNRGLTTKEGYSLKAENAVKAFEDIFESSFKGNITIAGTESDMLISNLNNSNALKLVEAQNKKGGSKVSKPKAKVRTSDDTNDAPKKLLERLLKDLLKLSEEQIDYDVDFGEYGIDSLSLADMLGVIEEYYGKPFEPSIITEYPNINLLAQYLGENFSVIEDNEMEVEEEKVQEMKQDLARPEVLKMLYEGVITVDEAFDYMVECEIVAID